MLRECCGWHCVPKVTCLRHACGVFGGRIFKEVMELTGGQKGGSWAMGLESFRDLEGARTEEWPREGRRGAGHPQARKRDPTGNQPAGTSISHVRPPEVWGQVARAPAVALCTAAWAHRLPGSVRAERGSGRKVGT